MSVFDADFDLADRLLAECFGAQVQIQRNGVLSDPVTAEVLTRESEATDTRGLRQIIRSREYLIAVEDYVCEGVVSEPRKGDLLVEASGAKHSVQPIVDKPTHEYASERRTRWLVRTKDAGGGA